MSKRIRLSSEQIEEFVNDFKKALEKSKGDDGKITVTKQLDSLNEKATVYFMPLAWSKMVMLIAHSEKEVAWHGLAYRCEGENGEPIPNEYVITDILVYPQQVTGTTVEMDEDDYDPWLMGLEKDVFDGIRMQGHSHVRMATNPSGTDITWNNRILQTVRDDMFYIFMIWNKSLSRNIKIYDVQNNIYFDNDDVEVGFLDYDGMDLCGFISEADNMIKAKVYTPVATTKEKTDIAEKTVTKQSKQTIGKGMSDYDYAEYYNKYGWRSY